MSARSEAAPPAAIRAAQKKARQLAARIPGVLAVGIGHKHSRDDGYGRGRPAVKFLVRAKADPEQRAQRIPRTLTVAVDGQSYRVPTDVEAVGRLRPHGVPACFASDGNVEGCHGTPGFLLDDPSGARYLVTAGHVLFNLQQQNPWSSPSVPVFVDGDRVGTAVAQQTFFLVNVAGQWMRRDVGLVKLNTTSDVMALFQRAPWSYLQRVATGARLSGYFTKGAPPQLAQGFGQQTSPLVYLDQLLEEGLDVPGAGTYAPKIIRSRAEDVPFADGDSGGPLVTDNGATLVGLHVVGDDTQPFFGWSISAEAIIRDLSNRLQRPLKLTTI